MFLDTSSIVGTLFCIKGDPHEKDFTCFLYLPSSRTYKCNEDSIDSLLWSEGVGSLISVGGWADIWCQLLADKDPHTVYVGQDDDGDGGDDDKYLQTPARGIMLITVNPRYVVGSIMVLLLVYWVPATLYTLVDLFRPACLYKYKVTTYS